MNPKFCFYKRLTIIFFLTISYSSFSQLKPGQWRDHLPYRMVERLAIGDGKIYCSTPNSLFFYDLADNSVNKISKIQGLTDNTISVFSYLPKQKSLLIVHDNASIDLYNETKVETIPYLKNKIDLYNKKVNEIDIINDLAYLSCGFGITVLDPEKKVFLNSYYPGAANKVNEVYDVCTDGANIYASTEFGIYKADLADPYLIDFNRWTLLKNFESSSKKNREIEYFNNKLFVRLSVPNGYMQDSIVYFDGSTWYRMDLPVQNFNSMVKSNNKLVFTGSYYIYIVDQNLNVKIIDGTKYDNDAAFAILDDQDRLWAANRGEGLISFSSEPKSIYPDGPKYIDIQNLSLYDDEIWVANGSTYGTYESTFNNSGFSFYKNGKWSSFTPYDIPGFDFLRDLVTVVKNPANPNQVYFSSYLKGLFEFNLENHKIYNSKNSGIQEDYRDPGKGIHLVYGLDYDTDGNLWMTNSRAKKPLVVKKKDGNWKSFSIPTGFNFDYRAGPVLVSSWQHKWLLSPQNGNVIVFDDNGTIDNESDDRTTVISVSKVESLTQSNAVYCIVEDKDENIWLGTDAGPVVVRNAKSAFEPENISVSKVRITLSKEDNIAAFLLEQEKINAIAIDGNNRKWFATENSGVYLMSADGTEQINHFTAENSPLLSNNVVDIDIHPKSGEVFFSTDKGLISYRGFATEGGSEFGDVYVFPNPVRESYNGNIIVTNLLTDADVRITDVSGNLVFKTKALGGQAVWDGKNLLGKRVSTGVYIVFCSNEDGSKTFVTKLLFIH